MLAARRQRQPVAGRLVAIPGQIGNAVVGQIGADVEGVTHIATVIRRGPTRLTSIVAGDTFAGPREPGGTAMAAQDELVEHTTAAAVAEKAKLVKHFSRFDILFFL